MIQSNKWHKVGQQNATKFMVTFRSKSLKEAKLMWLRGIVQTEAFISEQYP